MARRKPKKSEQMTKAGRVSALPSTEKTWPAALGLAVAGILAYWNSFQGVFIFDDAPNILQNSNVRTLFPPWDAMFSSFNRSRPLLGLSVAFNYAVSGFDIWSYHAFNLSIHILAALTLFGLVRHALHCERLRERFSGSATALAFCAALLWVVHPLQTQSVTYIIQRSESMMGLFYFLTLYYMARGHASARPPLWYAGAVASCALGVCCKPVIATAPIAAYLYDAVFIAGSFKDALRRRWRVYASLAGTWVLVAILLLSADKNIKTIGFHISGLTPWNYLATQCGVILHYLRLSLWPAPLVFDYGWPVARTMGEILPAAIVVGALFLAAVAALFRRSAWGFAGFWFFLILAPTSSIVPVEDIAVEHRMYLSLAAVCMLAVFGAHALLLRLWPVASSGDGSARIRRAAGIILTGLAAAALIALTIVRNAEYRNAVGLWRDVVSKRPLNPRAYTNLGFTLSKSKEGNLDEALKAYEHALQLKPDDSQANFDLGSLLLKRLNPPDLPGSIAHSRAAIQAEPDHVGAHYNLGCALSQQGKRAEAIAAYLETIKYSPRHADAHYNLANEYLAEKNYSEAAAHYEEAIKIKPDYTAAYENLGIALTGEGKPEEAVAKLTTVIKLYGDSPHAHNNLGYALMKLGRIDEAVEHFRKTLQCDPNFLQAQKNLDAALQKQKHR